MGGRAEAWPDCGTCQRVAVGLMIRMYGSLLHWEDREDVRQDVCVFCVRGGVKHRWRGEGNWRSWLAWNVKKAAGEFRRRERVRSYGRVVLELEDWSRLRLADGQDFWRELEEGSVIARAVIAFREQRAARARIRGAGVRVGGERQCLFCGRPLIGRQKQARYCGQNCRRHFLGERGGSARLRVEVLG